MQTQPLPLKTLLAFAGIYLIWGTTYLAIAISIQTMPPFVSGAIRFFIASGLLYVWLRWRDPQPFAVVDLKRGAMTGVLMPGIGNGLVIWAEQGVPSGITALIVAAIPIPVLIFDWAFFTKRAPTLQAISGIVVALLGVILIVMHSSSLSGNVRPIHLAALIVAVSAWSLGTLVQKHTPLKDRVMSFITDEQTLNDLKLVGRHDPQSIYNLFNKVRTKGGERILRDIFRNPLSDPDEINRRHRIFQFFHAKALDLPFDPVVLATAESFMQTTVANSYFGSLLRTTGNRITALALRDTEFGRMQDGLLAVLSMLSTLKEYAGNAVFQDSSPIHKELVAVREILADHRLERFIGLGRTVRLSVWEISLYSYLLQVRLQPQMDRLLNFIYYHDVYSSVAAVALLNDFSYAIALPKGERVLRTAGLRPPRLGRGVANAVSFSTCSNMIFLTGANMAGKSTLMKAVGITVYLAHMGFPVAADDMVFSVMDGLYSSINVSDNLQQGYSHGLSRWLIRYPFLK